MVSVPHDETISPRVDRARADSHHRRQHMRGGRYVGCQDVRPPSRNLDAARPLGHYRTMLRIRAFEEAVLEGLEEKLALGASAKYPGPRATCTAPGSRLSG